MRNFAVVYHILLSLTLLQPAAYAGKSNEDDTNEKGKRERKNSKDINPKGEKKSKSSLKRSNSSTTKNPDLEKLILSTASIETIRKGTREVWGEELKELIKLARKGNTEAAGKIGVTCYALCRYTVSTYETQADLIEDDECAELAFKWLTYAHEKGDQCFKVELGFCHLLGTGQVFEDSFTALKLFKDLPTIEYMLDPERELKRRLLLAESGFDRFIIFNEKKETQALQYLPAAAKTSNVAKCLLANRMLGTDKTNEGIEILINLQHHVKNPLAQWLLGRAYLMSIGVKGSFQEGMKWAFEAARNGNPKAMVFMNTSYPSTQKTTQKTSTLPRTLRVMTEMLQSFTNKLYYFEENQILLTFSDEVTSLLTDLKKAPPGLWISCLQALDKMKQALNKSPDPSFLYECKGTLTWGEANVSLAKRFDAFLPTIDKRFEEVFAIIEASIKELESKEASKRIESESAKEWRAKRELTSEANQLKKKLVRMNNILLNLKTFLGEIKGFKETTQEDRNSEFLLHYPFFQKME